MNKGILKITALVLVVVISIFMASCGDGGSSSSGSSKASGSSASQTSKSDNSGGKNTLDFIEYIDSSRDMEYKYVNGLLSTRSKFEYDFTVCLKPNDTQDVLSFKWAEKEGKEYVLETMKLDDSGENYVYMFSALEGEEMFFITSPDIAKAYDSKIDFSNKTEETAGGKTLYVGKFNNSSNIYQLNEKKGDVEAALLYVNGKNDADNAAAELEAFSKYVLEDDGSAFLVDYMLTNLPVGNAQNKEQAIYVKSYKYVKEISYLASSGSLVNANTGLNYVLENDGVKYEYSDKYMLLTEDKANYDVQQTGVPISNGEMFSAFIPEDNVFAITINLKNTSNKVVSRYGFAVSDADKSKGANYYIGKFTDMFQNANGNHFS